MSDDARPNLEPIEKALERLGVGAVFGEPVKEGDVTVIPVAEVSFSFGYGHGSGRERPESGGPATGEGSGGGSGATGRASPKGYIRISPEGVWFDPVPDVTRIALAGIAFAAWTAFWVGRAIKARSDSS